MVYVFNFLCVLCSLFVRVCLVFVSLLCVCCVLCVVVCFVICCFQVCCCLCVLCWYVSCCVVFDKVIMFTCLWLRLFVVDVVV